MKNLILVLVSVFFCIGISHAQQTYNKVRVTLKSGPNVKGSKASLNSESVSFNQGGLPKTYELSEVRMIEARKGSTMYWALGCGGGCALIYAITLASNDPASSGYTNSQVIPGAILLVGISAGVGILIGELTDKYRPVYTSNQTSFMNHLDLSLTTKRLTKYNANNYGLTLAYKF